MRMGDGDVTACALERKSANTSLGRKHDTQNRCVNLPGHFRVRDTVDSLPRQLGSLIVHCKVSKTPEFIYKRKVQRLDTLVDMYNGCIALASTTLEPPTASLCISWDVLETQSRGA